MLQITTVDFQGFPATIGKSLRHERDMKTEGEGGEALAESYELIGRILATLVLGVFEGRMISDSLNVHRSCTRSLTVIPASVCAHVEKGLGNVAGGVQHPVSFVLGLPQAVFANDLVAFGLPCLQALAGLPIVLPPGDGGGMGQPRVIGTVGIDTSCHIPKRGLDLSSSRNLRGLRRLQAVYPFLDFSDLVGGIIIDRVCRVELGFDPEQFGVDVLVPAAFRYPL
ncbi:hypothetical protein B5V01_35660 [Mesorhizobium erdmanii]|uniref:Uncharacterized protein n=2 Tax=Mesorhizobium TaxID=68287 RepID=A0A4Q1UIX1_9HYPH|nr:hypothetical protein B5V01_35660 [Mesorhizobium erdmanii]